MHIDNNRHLWTDLYHKVVGHLVNFLSWYSILFLSITYIQQRKYNACKFDINDAKSYSNFLKTLENQEIWRWKASKKDKV